MNWEVPFFDLDLSEDEKNAVINVLDSNWLTAGPRIEEFEHKFSELYNNEIFSIAVSSSTAALHLSLIALNIGPGDEVILPSLTFVACANTIKYVGAKPIFADIVSETDWTICPKDVERKITQNTKAIMPVHFAGFLCDMFSLEALAKKHNIHIIEDCSHAPNSKLNGSLTGSFGTTGCFSFYSNKNITTGEGGMLVTKSKEIAEKIKILRSHGINTSTFKRHKGHAFGYDVTMLGYNYRLDEMRAAIGIQQLNKLKIYNQLRKDKAYTYINLLSSLIPSIKIPFMNHRGSSCHHIFPILLPETNQNRDIIINELKKSGIQCSLHYRPIHTFSSYSDENVILEKTDYIYPSILTLPLFPKMSEKQIRYVVNTLKNLL